MQGNWLTNDVKAQEPWFFTGCCRSFRLRYFATAGQSVVGPKKDIATPSLDDHKCYSFATKAVRRRGWGSL
jgi:hypothetical protein